MRHSLTRIVGIALTSGLALFAAATPRAEAGFTVSFDSANAVGSNTKINYTASIGSTDSIVAGDSFRIYDFTGYVGGTVVAPKDWVGSVGADNVAPPSVLLTHGNDVGVPNLTFTYTGTTPITGPSTLGGFSALSSFNTYAIKDFTGTVSGGGLRVSSVGGIQSPVLGGIPFPAPAPEPSSLISGAIGLVVAGLAYRRRRRTA